MTETVGAMLVRGGQVLLGKRAAHKSFAGRWDIIGGHIERGETPWAALSRELFEELGIVEATGQHLKIIDLPISTDRCCRVHIYLVSDWRGEPILSNDEHVDIRWFSVSEAQQLPDLATSQYVPIFASLA